MCTSLCSLNSTFIEIDSLHLYNNYLYKDTTASFLSVILKSLTSTNLPKSYFRKRAKWLHINW